MRTDKEFEVVKDPRALFISVPTSLLSRPQLSEQDVYPVDSPSGITEGRGLSRPSSGCESGDKDQKKNHLRRQLCLHCVTALAGFFKAQWRRERWGLEGSVAEMTEENIASYAPLVSYPVWCPDVTRCCCRLPGAMFRSSQTTATVLRS
ncbi:hypothetical protein RRG08_014789 [Elysia crispata]|uniref:Uncharacterized protein n=1 Tax=Elysia crispata TaxID=231223 RepID=A0AAE1AVD9_9GAST|nr:hypothetical protein RRG08_014789 [Elysia crispata]